MEDYSISSLRMSVCDDPGKYKKFKTNCVINRLMSNLFSFQSRNFIKLNKSKH